MVYVFSDQQFNFWYISVGLRMENVGIGIL
jgi:hypothetical protein